MNTSYNVRVYAAGGGGITIGYELEILRDKEVPGAGRLDVVYIDTSKSNLKPGIPEEACFLFGNVAEVDGSGQRRLENKDIILKRAKEILKQFPPKDVNIVISTGGGGSGSVIAPSIVAELTERKELVIVMIVGSKLTKMYALNTMNTLKSYEGISKTFKEPVVACYFENQLRQSHSEVNKSIVKTIGDILILASGQNESFDRMDLRNFLHYQTTTSFDPMLTILTVHSAEDTSKLIGKDLGEFIAVTTLSLEEADNTFPAPLEIQYTGTFPRAFTKDIKSPSTLHYVLSDGVFNRVIMDHQILVDQMKDSEKARVGRDNILSDHDKVESNGMVFD